MILKTTRVYDEKAYDWNRAVASAGNMAGIDPTYLAWLLDKNGIPWYTTGWPYSSGLRAYCDDDKLWNELIKKSKERVARKK